MIPATKLAIGILGSAALVGSFPGTCACGCGGLCLLHPVRARLLLSDGEQKARPYGSGPFSISGRKPARCESDRHSPPCY